MTLIRSLLSAAVALALSAPVPAADEPTPHTFDARGVKIRYLVQGRGEPVILIHGLHASAEVNWQKPGVMAALAKDHQVIALDLPGHGGSDKPDKEEAYGLQMVEDVILLLDHRKVPKAHVVGYSLGGMVAVKLMARHPDCVLSGTVGGMGWFRDGSRLQWVWEQMPVRDGARTPAACVRAVGKLAVTEEELKGIRVPVTVVVGDRDPVKRLYVAPLRVVRPDWPVVEVEGAGHLSCILRKQFADAIVGWVGQNTKK
jgi:pimeloyl-ACP methyl ester carboxylesterase